jgi:hypothetical protein
MVRYDAEGQKPNGKPYLSKRVWDALANSEKKTEERQGLPFAYFRWLFAELFGWTLEYIDTISISDLHEWIQITDGKNKAIESRKNRAPKGRRS